jgi:hypothetical protein
MAMTAGFSWKGTGGRRNPGTDQLHMEKADSADPGGLGQGAGHGHPHRLGDAPAADRRVRLRRPQLYPLIQATRTDATSTLAPDALVLSQMVGDQIEYGRILHGDNHTVLKVKSPSIRHSRARATITDTNRLPTPQHMTCKMISRTGLLD